MSQQTPATAESATSENMVEALKSVTMAQWAVLCGAVLLTVVLRLVDSPVTNFGSMIALTLLCGSVTRHRALILLPLGVRLLTDLLVQAKTGYAFFPSWPFDYGAYLVIFAIGRYVPARRYLPVLGGTIASVATYFVLSNLGVWMMWPETYPRSFAGLIECFAMALPFARGTIYGNLLVAPIFFAAWNMATNTSTETEASTVFDG